MIELLPAIASTLKLATKLGELSKKTNNAELMSLVGDLRLELAKLKIGTADLMEENDTLKRKVASLTSAQGKPCPKCGKKSYHLESSVKDKVFEEIGGVIRTYICDSCEFTEEEHVIPGT